MITNCLLRSPGKYGKIQPLVEAQLRRISLVIWELHTSLPRFEPLQDHKFHGVGSHGNARRGYSGYNCWVGAANSTKLKPPASGTYGLHCQRHASATRRARPVAFTAALAGRRGLGGPNHIADAYRGGAARCGAP